MFRLAALAAFLLASLAPAQTPRSKDAAIGVWPWLVGNVDGYQDEIVAKAKAAGLDTVYVHVWRTTGSKQGELRIFDETRRWNPADGRLIPQITLSRFIAKAHTAGLQVVAVVQVFRSPAPLPSDGAHRDHIIRKVLRYLVHSYDARGARVYAVDGIALDFIRWFGGNHDARDVDRFLDEMRREVGSMPIHAFLIASAWYIDGPVYDNRFRSYAQAMSLLTASFGQSWEDIAKRIDCILPMAYTANGHVYGSNLRLMEGYLNAVARYARQAVRNAGTRCRVNPAIRVWTDGKGTTTRQTVEASARGAMAGGADGFMAFRYFTARSHADWFAGLARWSEPGPDLPIATLSGTASGILATADTTGSRHAKFAAARLRARFDLDNDGTLDTGPVPIGRSRWILPGPGRRRVGVSIRDPAGHTAVTAVEIGVPDLLSPATSTVSAGRGGSVFMRLQPGPALAGSFYVVLGTMSGTSPGTSFGGGVRLPVNIDFFTVLAGGLINQGPFQSFFGSIGLFGIGSPRLVLPPGLVPPGLVGSRLHFAALDLEPRTLRPRYASNAVEVRIVR